MLASGTKLGPYEVLAPLGAGGMGEVYRARDTRLGRDVAVKVLPAEFTRDPERLRRFEQEARAVSALNHPNILTIFDIGTHEGSPYVVYELLEGVTLRESGTISQRKALEYAQQITQGLAAAHDKDITHRDLKPENLFVTTDGRVKILDFGLAKVATSENAATVIGQTQQGAVLGTVGYMSPEQVRGEAADHRADIFSFGAILYEMLSGKRAFQASSSVSTMHAILTEDPPELEHAALDRIVRHCLEKSPAQRFQSARDIGFALEAISGSASATALPALPQPRRKPWAAIAIAAAIVTAAAAGYWLHAPRSQTNWSATLLPSPPTAFEPRVSPDGRTVAFEAMVDNLTQVGVINPESGNWTVLTKNRSRGYVEHLCWSHDGSTIYYHRLLDYPRGIYSVPMLGGEERLVLEDAGRPEVLPDGSLLVTKINAQRQPQLHRFWPQSGRLDPLPALIVDDEFTPIRAFSDGLEAAFFGRHATGDNADHLYAIELASGRLRRLDTGIDTDPRVLAVDSVHNLVLAVVKSGDLRQMAMLPRSGSGRPQTILSFSIAPWFADIGPDGSVFVDQVQRPTEVLRFPASGGAPEQLPGTGLHFQATSNHVMQLPDGSSLFELPFAGHARLLVAAPGKDPQPLVQTNEETSMPAALLPGGKLAFVLGSGAQQTIAIASLADGRIVRRLAGTGGATGSLAASPDGQTLYYSSTKMIWAIPNAGGVQSKGDFGLDGGQPRRIISGDSVTVHPNGRELVIQINEAEGARLVRMPVGGGEPRPIALQVPPGMRMIPTPLTSNAIFKDGRILIGAATPDFWFYQVAVADPETGRVQKVPLQFEGDIISPGWTRDGKIVALGERMNSSLWRFRPVK